MTRFLLLLAVLGLTACGDLSRNLFEGIKSSNDAKRTPSERAMTPAPSYEEYKKEREAPSGK